MGTTDLRKIRDGIISRSEHSTTQIGMILGIIGTALSVLGILYMIFVAVLVADAMHGYRY
jgi:hypothetical protein